MDPITMALALSSTALSAGGSLYAGFRGSKAAMLAAEIARGNADMLTRTAEVQALDAPLAVKRGSFEERKLRAGLEDVIGGQDAHFAAAGLDASDGSPLHLAFMTAAQGEVDAGLIRAQARLDEASALGRAASTRQAAAGQAGQAFASAERGNDALVAGYFGAATAVLKGASGMWGSLSGGSTPKGDTGGGFTPAMPQFNGTDYGSTPFQINRYGGGAQPFSPYRLY